jgi:hypothetical protein
MFAREHGIQYGVRLFAREHGIQYGVRLFAPEYGIQYGVRLFAREHDGAGRWPSAEVIGAINSQDG